MYSYQCGSRVSITVARVGVESVAAPVTPLVSVRVDGEVEVVQLRVVDVSPHVDAVKDLRVRFIFAESSYLKTIR